MTVGRIVNGSNELDPPTTRHGNTKHRNLYNPPVLVALAPRLGRLRTSDPGWAERPAPHLHPHNRNLDRTAKFLLSSSASPTPGLAENCQVRTCVGLPSSSCHCLLPPGPEHEASAKKHHAIAIDDQTASCCAQTAGTASKTWAKNANLPNPIEPHRLKKS